MICNSTKPCLGLYEKAISNTLNWEEKLCLAWQSGFDFLEMSIDPTEQRLKRLYDSSFAPTLRAAMDRTGFKVQTLALTANRGYPLGSEDTIVRSKGIELVRRAVEMAGETGIRVIHLAAYDEMGEKRNARTMDLFREAVFACAKEGEAAGVMLALETMDVGEFCGMDGMLKLLKEIDSPYLKCYADIGNLTATGHDAARELRKGKGYIVGVHLKDTLPGICRDVPFGKGAVNFEEGLRALFETGYRGFFVAEMWSYDDEAFHDNLKYTSQFLRERLDAAFPNDDGLSSKRTASGKEFAGECISWSV